VAFLAAKALDLADGHAFDADFVQCIFYVIQLEWLDDGFDFFHGTGSFPWQLNLNVWIVGIPFGKIAQQGVCHVGDAVINRTYLFDFI
jgi:hypothetical protein